MIARYKDFGAVLIAALGLVVYSNTLHAPFVFDDGFNIVDNPAIRDFSYFLHPSKVKGLKLEVVDVAANFKTRYVPNFTFAINYALGGLNVAGYHIVNILIHIINALFVYALAWHTLQSPYFRGRVDERASAIALFCGLLFACHPMETQAVTYITQRYASLCAMFYLGAMVFYARWRLGGKLWCYFAALTSVILAMFTKENAVTAPVAIALWEFSFANGEPKKRLAWLIPFFITVSLIPLTLFIDGRTVFAGVGTSDFTRWEYLFTQFHVMTKYLAMVFVPIGQNLDHDVAVIHSFANPLAFSGFALLLALAGYGVYLYYRSRGAGSISRVAAFGVIWFLIAASVESSIFPIGSELIYEHRMYLPSAGFFMAMVTLAGKGKWVTGALAVAVVVYAVTAYARNEVWKSDVTLWEDSVAKSPGKERPLENLGHAYIKAGRMDEAVASFEKAAALEPDNYRIRNHLAKAYHATGMVDDAVGTLQEALKIDPAAELTHSNLGVMYMALNRWEDAVREYETILKNSPVYPAEAHANLGAAYHMRGMREQAAAHYQAALRLNPELDAARRNLETLLGTK